MGAIFSTYESVDTSSSSSQPSTNPPLEETAPTPQSGGEVVGEGQENNVDGGAKDGDEGEDEEEEGECGFCLFMKAGGCRDNFVAWEKCVEESEKNGEDIVEKCYGVTTALKACMEVNPDYYGPILKAEKAAEAEVVKELEKEKEMKTEETEAEKAENEEKAEKAEEKLEKEKEKKSEESKSEKAVEAEAEATERFGEREGEEE